ncbi:small subunit processome component 20 homolog [Schistocerca americana]|uniref:small subunit processome component 20 homolog n=1 Tax=Schistocerca americana TaxID=7009 RepID=UPI001F4F722E|nr:small subunit processome component 20 homolog [Schistocerca americana]
MKNKPTRHKERNTFKFQPFSERIANIDIDVFHRVRHKFEDADEDDTYMHQCLQKWNVLNLTDSYDNFKRELPNVQTLPLILNQKEVIVAVILKHLAAKDPLSLQPILELVVALAQDLRQEIYPFYQDILQKLIPLLSSKDADQLEWTFNCLAYLFKFLWRYLVKDVDAVFDSLIPLLGNSKPPYINNFAAESFAFIARKVKDKTGFLALILKTLQEKPEGVSGCGRLLFEVIKGVSGQFHSCAETILPLYMKSLNNAALPQDLLFDVLSHFMTALTSGTHPQKANTLWTALFETLQFFQSSWSTDRSQHNEKALLYLLKLFYQLVQHKNGVFIVDSGLTTKHLINILEKHSLPDSVLSVVLDIGACLLLSSQLRLSQEHASLLLLKILGVPRPTLWLEFTRKIMTYSGFDTLVLPRLLQYCNSCLPSNEDCHRVLYVLTQLLLYKAPLCASGCDLEKWHVYPLNFAQFERLKTRQSLVKATFCDFVIDILQFKTAEELASHFEDCVCALICLPHLIPQKTDEKFISALIHLAFKFLCQSSVNNNSMEVSEEERGEMSRDAQDFATPQSNILNEEQLLYFICLAIETMVHIMRGDKLEDILKLEVIDDLLPYACKPRFVNALRAIDIYLTAINISKKDDDVRLTLLKKLHNKLERNLSSPFHKVRFLTAHIFTLFESESKESETLNNNVPTSVFHLCFTSESIPPTVQDYRQKLQHMQNLEYEATRVSLSQNCDFNKVPLHHLLGTLYINFQLLWEPTGKLISSYARGMQLSDFWSVFGDQLRLAAVHIKAPMKTEDLTESCSLFKNEFLQLSYVSLNEMNDKPDYVNYRILLWKTFAEFPEICEVKNKEVSPIFLSFVEDEFFRTNVQEAKTVNIKRKDTALQTDTLTNENESSGDSEEEPEEAVVHQEITFPKERTMTAKEFVRTLAAHMSVFAKLRNPKAIFRESELSKLYYDLLMHKNNDVQKLALSCLLTYKHKFLLPYQPNLFNLLDDKTFKSEITMFRIDKESDVIQTEHREKLIPIIMRIVYSKMLTKTGSKSTGKAAAQLRRSLVLRFLAGCHENELMIFVQMAFKNLMDHLKDDTTEMITTIDKSLNLECAPNPKQLQSSVNLLGVVLDKFGSLMGQQLLPYVLRVILCVGAIVKGLLERREMIFPAYIPALRTLRNSCTAALIRFFSQFDEFIWSPTEIDTVFDVFVWPSLERLPTEGVHSPTALLELFITWSHNARYFVLFAKHLRGNPDVSPLPYIMKLLLGEKTHSSVRSGIIEIVENLLTLQDHQKQQEDNTKTAEEGGKFVPPLQVNFVLPLDEDVVSQLSLNYGSGLLLPHVPAILEHLKRKLSSSKAGLGHRDLEVLARVSELVHDPSTSELLLQLLLPTLNRKASASEETVIQLFTTITNLVKNIAYPLKYLRSLAPLFGTVSATAPRKLLCDLVMAIAERDLKEQKSDVVINAQLLMEINAWDARWIEQPDFNRRLDGFKRVKEMLSEGKINLDFGVMIIHNCFHILKSEKDMSLRDSAGYCLRNLAPVMCHKHSDISAEREFLISDTLLNLIRQGIKDFNEVVRHESLCLLGELARQCEELHPVLRDLSKLSSKTDPEVDFFENIVHLQSHRKARALLKFCEVAKGLVKPPTPRTLTHFILPCASLFLCSEKFANKNSLVDAAIQAVGMVCRLLPWHQYETVLRFYLGKMRVSAEFQRQLVRIIIAILDAFHFNLDRAVNNAGNDVKMSSLENAAEGAASDEKDKIMLTAGHEEAEKDSVIHSEHQSSDEEKTDEVVMEKDLDTLLDSCENEQMELETGIPENKTFAVDQEAKLPKSAASRVVSTITNSLLPQLQRTIGQRSVADTLHKLNRRQTGPDQDEEDVLRVPVALASVKLLQKLPQHVLDQHLPGIFMRLCTFLKSRMDSVRRIAREILQKIMVTLGPSYLSVLLSEMSSLLTKGFQVHVLVYTVHSVLVVMKDMFRAGDVDNCLQSILELCKLDLFGASAEEKSVSQITARFFEAKSTKSYDMFHIVSQCISEKCLTDLLLPLKEVLVQSHNHKIVNKVSECLRQVAIGLSENNFVSAESLVIFVYGVTSQSIPELSPELKKEEIFETEKEKLSIQRPDSFLIPEAPRSRSGATNVKAKTSSQANAHVLVEFGLRLFHILLKKERLKSQYYKQFLDPMVSILHDCLRSQHVKRSTQALQCLSWILKMDLPSIKTYGKELTTSIFTILHKYAVSGISKGDNYDLVAAAFKAVTVLVRDVEQNILSSDQLKALLLYAEKDMHDYQRQATAFGLLRAILVRRFIVSEIPEVMQKVAALSITSEHSHVRMQARQVFHQYIMHYPLGKKLDHHLSFCFAQLRYPIQSGRESALEMLEMIVTSFPQEMLEEHGALFFISVSPQLVNDESPDCRKMVAKCIKTILERLGKSGRNSLFEIVMVWLQEPKVKHRQLAAQLCGLFVQAEKQEFETRFQVVLPVLLQQFGRGFEDNRPGRFVRVVPAASDANSETKKEQKEIRNDHLLFQVLQTLLKICEHCPSFLKSNNWKYEVEGFAENAKLLLSHEHEWVRLGAAQFLGFVFGSLDPQRLAFHVCKKTNSDEGNYNGCGFLNNSGKLRSLILDLSAQLQPVEISDDFVEQVVKDLVYLARVLKYLEEEDVPEVVVFGSEQQMSDDEEQYKSKLSLVWMIRRMRRILNNEIIHSPQSTTLQKAVFKWIGAVAVDLGKEKLPLYLHHLLPPLVRVLTSSDDSNSELRRLAKEVADIIKKKVGTDEYTHHFTKLQMSLTARRADRKKIRAQEAVTEPQKAAKRRIKKQLKRKDSKKKKISAFKGKPVKRKHSDKLSIDEII